MKNEEAKPTGRTGRPAGPVVLATRPVNRTYGAGTYRTGTAIPRLALHVTALLDVTAKGATANANRAEAPCWLTWHVFSTQSAQRAGLLLQQMWEDGVCSLGGEDLRLKYSGTSMLLAAHGD